MFDIVKEFVTVSNMEVWNDILLIGQRKEYILEMDVYRLLEVSYPLYTLLDTSFAEASKFVVWFLVEMLDIFAEVKNAWIFLGPLGLSTRKSFKNMEAE